MPGGDRTGPNGMGPMTGRAAGLCSGAGQPGYYSRFAGGGRFGGGFGPFGGGRRRRFWRYPINIPFGGYPDFGRFGDAENAEVLKKEAEYMQENLDAINERIRRLEENAKGE